MNGQANNVDTGWLDKFTQWIRQFIDAVADARIPPDSMPIVPEQGYANAVTGGIGVILYSAATQILAGGRDFSLASNILLVVVSAILLFLAALIVLAIAKGKSEILALWQRLTSVFMVVWLLSLVTFVLLTYPLLLIAKVNLLDETAYALSGIVSDHPRAWRDDLVKSLICSFLAGLFVLYRTRLRDPDFSLKSGKPWVWLAMVTIVVGVVMDVALFQSWRNA